MMQSTLQYHDVGVEKEVPEGDHLVAEYLGELRRFDLLNWEDETALWQRIEQGKTRARRALYTSPIALPTLKRMWCKMQGDEGSLHHLLAQDNATAPESAAAYTQVEQAIRHLSDLSAKLRSLKWQRRGLAGSTRELRTLRQEQAGTWRDWLATWEQMTFHPNVHEAMRQVLDTERHANPDDLGLRVAHDGWQRAQRELEQAKAQILCANLRLVVYMAKKYRDQDVPFLDLIQEGNIGLMRAIDRFKPERGFKFVTYAYWWVRQAIGRTLIEQSGTVQVPAYVVERQQKLRVTSDQLYQIHGRLPTSQELSAALGWTPKAIERLWNRSQVFMSLHTPLTDDGRILEDMLGDDRVAPPENHMEKRELRQCLASGLDGLTEREAQILRMRFGLENGRSHSLREIGECLGLSHERIRQIERLALDKLRTSE